MDKTLSTTIFIFLADKPDNSQAIIALNELTHYICELEVRNETLARELDAKHHGY